MSSFKILNARVQVTLFSLVITACLFIPPFFDLKYRQTKTSFLLLPFFACFVFFSLLSGGSFTVNVLNNSLLKRLYPNDKIPSDSSRVSPLKWLLSIDKSSFLLSTILSIAFFFIYLISGLIILGNAEVSNHPNLDLFGADIKDWINLQYYRDGYKPAHTNILLIVQPLETLFSFLPFPQSVSAVLLNSFFSSVSIFLTSALFWQMTQRYLYTFLPTLLLGLTTSHIVFGSIPESYTLGYSSLAITYILFLRCLKNKKLNIGLWILAGIFSFGITITNFVQTLICFITIFLYIHETLSKKHIKPILEYVGTVISCSIFLSIFQNKLYNSDYFFLPGMFVYETKSFITNINLLTQPLLIINELFKHFFLVNIVAMNPSIINSYIYQIPQLSFFGAPLSYSLIGLIAALLWICILVTGIYHNIVLCITRHDKEKMVFLGAVCLSILFNMAFHSFYGTVEMFIYTCYFTFLVIMLTINTTAFRKPLFRVASGILISLMAINNFTILRNFKEYF